MTATWKGKAGEIRSLIEQLALPNGKECLFNPLPLLLVSGALSVRAQTKGPTSFLVADIAHEGISVEGEALNVSLDAPELIKFLALYDGATEVEIAFGDPVTIKGGGRTCKFHPEAKSAAIGKAAPSFKDGIVQTKDGRGATTIVTVDASQLQSIVADAKTVEVPEFPIKAGTDGLRVSLGGLEKKPGIDRHIEVVVEGTDAVTTVGEDLAVVLNHVAGPLKLQMFTHAKPHPLTVVSGGINYVLLPRVPK